MFSSLYQARRPALLCAVGAMVFLFFSTGCGSTFAPVSPTPNPSSKPSAGVEIQNVIDQVKVALADTQTRLMPRGLELTKATLSLQAVTSDQGDAGIKYLILTGNEILEHSATKQIDITLTRIPPAEKEVSPLSLTKELEDLIFWAA